MFVVLHGEHMVFSRSMSGMAMQGEAALVGEVKRSLAGYASQYPRERLDAIYLSEGHGGGGWAARLQQALPVPVHPLDPLAGMPAADAVPPHLRGRFTAAAGLLAALAVGPLPINFVTPRQPRAEPNKALRWVLLALGLLVVAVGGAVAASVVLNGQLAAKENAAKKRQKAAEDDIATERLNANKVKAIEDFRSRSVNWLDVFYDITDATPNVDKMRLREFDGTLKDPKADAKSPAGGSTASAAKPPTLPGAKPGAPAAKGPPPADPVGKLTLTFITASDADDAFVHKLVDQLFAQENKFYAKPDTRTQQSSRRESIITVDLLSRKPDQYTRKLTAKFPELPPPAGDQPPPPFDGGELP